MASCLNKQWKELLFSFAGFGPNFLMVLMGAYFTDAINPAALPEGSLQAINGTCLILPAVFPILWLIAKAFDGIVDVPMAALTDSLKTKWGNRRPPIAVCTPIMIVSYLLCWIPVGGSDQLVNTIWIFIWALLFFTTYTLALVSYYGSFSTVCTSELQRSKISSYKAFFDTISYCVVYALVPVLLNAFNITIDKLALYALPLMLTMIIPLFLIKEGEKYGYPERKGLKEERVSTLKSMKITFGNKLFRRWLIVNSCSFFGLQMFLVGMNSMIIGGMGFGNLDMAVLNTCAFAPVPVMLYLFNKLKAKKGIRFSFQTCLLSFAVSILSFFFASTFVTGGDKLVQYIIACVGGLCGSWSIGSFFMVPYIIPSQIASVEQRTTGKNHSAMYFAAQALTTCVVGAIASGGVYEYIKLLFIDKATNNVVVAENIEQAAEKMGASADTVFNLGILIIPFVVSAMCIVGFFVAFKMPKDFKAELVAEELKKNDPDVDLSKAAEDDAPTDKDSVVINTSLWVLSGSIFGFIWNWIILSKANRLTNGKHVFLKYLLCTVVPFFGAYYLFTLRKSLQPVADEKHIKLHAPIIYLISGIILPIVSVNFLGLALLTSDTEKLVD